MISQYLLQKLVFHLESIKYTNISINYKEIQIYFGPIDFSMSSLLQCKNQLYIIFRINIII
jgi:hypothetical protein